ncbi:oligosaccharide flippase family protein [Salinicoccus cyprini]|uniref:Oligosaccharide flippase family protein n=1 Tax=Salinicoccus cyprini TaxID=2493691 RepID=A0A558AXD1_9STAP|nr:oligosaccharide flippase family protein [Salinicoccus cyprini]TVT28910.1 oligosaccharide flippase family protein [Salinicoccus cyprini]
MKVFIKNLFTLMTGTLAGQAIIILTMPIISRIYSPASFGIYSSTVAIINIIAVATTLRYEIAIAISKDLKERYILFSLSLIVNVLFTIALAIILLLVNFLFSMFSYFIIFYIVISVFLIGLLQIFTNIGVSYNEFKVVSFTKFSQSFTQVLIQLVGYFFKENSFFLFLGYTFGKANGLTLLANKTYSHLNIKLLSKKELKKVAYKFRRFPLYVLPSSLINAFTSNIVVILILVVYGGFYAGIYGFVMRIINAPSQLISKSFNNALYKFSHDSNIHQLRKVYLITASSIAIFISLILLIFLSVKINIFTFFFGEEWAYVNKIITPLLFMMIFQFSVIPLSEILTILNKQNIKLAWDIIKLFITLALFFMASIKFIEFNNLILIYSILMSCLYILLHYFIVKELYKKYK